MRPKLLNLQDPQLATSVVSAADGYDVTIKAKHPALWAWVDIQGDPDATCADNFLHLSGESAVTLHVNPSKQTSLSDVISHLKVRSLFNTYLPEAPLADREIEAGPDGKLAAMADKAEIVGDSDELEPGEPANIGGWTEAGDELEWTLNIKRAGAYRVLMDTACPAGTEGSEISVRVGDVKVTGAVPATGGWRNYTVVDLGIIHVDKTGHIHLALRVAKMPHANVMDLRSIVLQPGESN